MPPRISGRGKRTAGTQRAAGKTSRKLKSGRTLGAATRKGQRGLTLKKGGKTIARISAKEAKGRVTGKGGRAYYTSARGKNYAVRGGRQQAKRDALAKKIRAARAAGGTGRKVGSLKG